MKTYGLSPLFALPTHMKFSISFLKYISYKDLIFDRWKKNNNRFENFITKALAKICSYGLLNDQNLDLIFKYIYMGHFLLDWWVFSLDYVCQKDV